MRLILLSAFAVFFLLVSLTGPAYGSNETKITGEITNQQVSLTIDIVGAPSLSIIKPKNHTYISNQSLPLNYTVSGALNVWFNLDNGANTTISNVSSFTTFNTTEGSHTLYLFANSSTGFNSSTNVTFNVSLTGFRILYEEYKNVSTKGNSTDLNSYSTLEYRNFSQFYLENNRGGRMYFFSIVNLTNISGSTLDLDNYTNISFNRIEIDSSAIPNFNVSATLSLYNLTFSNPRILRDGAVCSSSICTNQSYSGGTLVFNVTGFSVYSAEETPSGGGGPSEQGGSTGGGGGGTTVRGANISLLNVVPENIIVTLKQGETKAQELIIKNNANRPLDIRIRDEKISNFLKVVERTFTLAPGETKIVILDFLVRENTAPDLYLGKLIIETEGEKKEVLIGVNVQSKEPLFDVKLEIPDEYKKVGRGGKVIGEIKIFNLGQIGRVDTLVEYMIKDKDGKSIITESENVAVETQTTFLKSLRVPFSAQPGTYVFYVRVIYNDEIAGSAAVFEVTKQKVITEKLILYIVIGGLILLMIIILYLIIRARKYLKTHRKIDEGKLAREGLFKTKIKTGEKIKPRAVRTEQQRKQKTSAREKEIKRLIKEAREAIEESRKP